MKLTRFLRREPPKPRRSVWKGLAAGGAAGLAGTLAMTGFQGVWSTAQRLVAARRGDEGDGQGGGESTPTTAVVASRAKEAVTGRPIEDRRALEAGGQLVHYGFGTLMGALFGALSEYAPNLRRGVGVPFGAAVWLAADEAALPTLKLAPPPWKTGRGTHAYAAASHALFGLTTDLVRRSVRRLLDRAA